jgi:hypothetical protein
MKTDKLRYDFCLPEADNTITNRQRNRLISALDFGVKGKVADETSGRDACECAGYCTPKVTPEEKGLSGFLEDAFIKKGFLKSILDATSNKKYLKELYRESLVQEELQNCVVGKPMPRPILPEKDDEPCKFVPYCFFCLFGNNNYSLSFNSYFLYLLAFPLLFKVQTEFGYNRMNMNRP